MSKWNCPVCDRDFEDSEEMDSGICRKCARYTADIQSACAAGPWRFDVENAPKDGTRIMGDFGCNDEPFNPHFVTWDERYWCNKDREFEYSLLRAFAVPNPPQKTGD